MKKRKRGRIIADIDSIVGKLIKIRDCWTCQHCKASVSSHNAHWSHVVPKRGHIYLRWNPMNTKTLCFSCHKNWWHQNILESCHWFEKKFPERHAYIYEEISDGLGGITTRYGKAVQWKDKQLVEILEELKHLCEIGMPPRASAILAWWQEYLEEL